MSELLLTLLATDCLVFIFAFLAVVNHQKPLLSTLTTRTEHQKARSHRRARSSPAYLETKELEDIFASFKMANAGHVRGLERADIDVQEVGMEEEEEEEKEEKKMTKKMYTFDDMILQRASDEDQSPLIAYPRTKTGVTDFETFSGERLHRLVDGAAKALMKAGVEPVYRETVVGIYGPSDLDYIITIFALGRLGYTIFILSPRLPVNAIVALLSEAKASVLLHAPEHLSIATKSSELLPIPVRLSPILTRPQYDYYDHSPPFTRIGVDGETENKKKLIMMHSSGSTGLPRPIHYTHTRLLHTMSTAQHLTSFVSVPLFHAHGFVSLIQGIYTRKTVYLFNGRVPQTHATVTAAIRASNPEIVWTVPYVLKLLAEKKDGIEALRHCKMVSCSGSRCPDELGDLMVKEGIHFGMAFGATEVALVLTSLDRPPSDKAWNYLRPPPHIAPFIQMKPIDGPICECVVLDGHRGKITSNSNSPPNSFHTKDLFVAHPTIPNAWKFVGRLDDRITLTNGEKVMPLPIEGRIQQEALVREAVVFGIGRSIPGLLIFKSESARGMSDEQLLDAVWPAIEDANSKAEGFSQITRQMIAVLGPDVQCPITDKSSIKRAAVYRDFQDTIDSVYQNLESTEEGTLVMGRPDLEKWILAMFKLLGVKLADAKTDFFSAGVDSLQAIQMRSFIIKNLALGGHAARVPNMVVYDAANAENLARRLLAIRGGEVNNAVDEIAEMRYLIEKYSVFNKRVEGGRVPESKVILLTGATGSLGSHILSQLVALPNVSRVYCPIRTPHPNETAFHRLTEALRKRKFANTLPSRKIIPLSSDLSEPELDLPSPMFEEIRSKVTHIIHCAWEVNFALPLSAMEPQLKALQTLIDLTLSSPFSKPAHLLFCSSVGTAMSTPSVDNQEILVREEPITDLAHASPTGYARSKLVGEHIVENAVSHAGANATILRIGQIIPAKEVGSQLWNANEMIPLLVRSADVTGVLPDSLGSGDSCSWIDNETLSSTILDIGGLNPYNWQTNGRKGLVYNLLSPQSFSWKLDFLAALKRGGVMFESVEREDWVAKLRQSEKDVEKNPSRKLLGFWEQQNVGGVEVRFETRLAEEKSEVLRRSTTTINDVYVGRLVAEWRKLWEGRTSSRPSPSKTPCRSR